MKEKKETGMRRAGRLAAAAALSGGDMDGEGFGLFKKGDNLLSLHGRESVQKAVNGFSHFEIINQGLHGDSCACEYGGPAHNVSRNADDLLVHNFIMRQKHR